MRATDGPWARPPPRSNDEPLRLGRPSAWTRDAADRALDLAIRAESTRGPQPSRFARSDDSDDALLARAISRAKAGDMGALQFLYVRYADEVCGVVQGILRNRDDAEDVTQAIFAGLVRKITKFEQREVPFAGWLLRVARNAAVDHIRARRQLPCEEVRKGDEEHDALGQDRARCLRQALEELPQDQREVLVLRHIAGMGPVEIAERLAKTEGSVHGLHHRGRGALQEMLRELGASPITAG